MDDKLIVSVWQHPELYNVTLVEYRDRNKKDIAWKKVSQEIGLSEDTCRKRWKNLRDTYMREKRKEKEKRRSGAAAGSATKWRFSVVLSFLDPFITPRQTSGNMDSWVEETQVTGDQEEPEEAAAGLSEAGEELDYHHQGPVSPLPEPPAAASSDQAGPSAAPTGPPRSRGRKRSRDGPSEFERELLAALRDRPPPPPPPPAQSEDEHFLLSLLPLLQKVPPQSKDLVKYQIHKLLFESTTFTLNLDALE